MPVIRGTNADDYIDLANDPLGIYWIYTYAGNDSVFGGPETDYIYGGSGEDDLFGEGGNDVLVGGDNNDLLDGHDLLLGGWGNDKLYGGFGGDNLDGEEGNDYLYGQAGDDHLDGGDGVDYLYGGEGEDFIRGGSGNDFIYAGTGPNTLWGDDGDDYIYGGWDVDPASGVSDFIYGGNGRDQILGNGGSDWITGGFGADRLTGGTGFDRFIYTDEDVVTRAFGKTSYKSYATDTITDFETADPNNPRVTGDLLDFHHLLWSETSFRGWTGQQAISQGYIYFVEHGTPGEAGFGTTVYVDPDGGAHSPAGTWGGLGADLAIVDLQNIAAIQLGADYFLV